jgi:hypothetical protein
MKVRWTRQSLRLRITPAELESLASAEPVKETLALAGWSVQVQPSSVETHLSTDGSCLTICLSRADAAHLAEPEREGVYFDHPGDVPFRYFIEKDFPCVHPRALEAMDTPTETFEEPLNFRARKGIA